MNLEQAKTLRPGDKIHYVGNGLCTKRIGPRGGVTVKVTEFRVNGQPQTWKSRPDRVRVPVKFGLKYHGNITEENLEYWHLSSECPLSEVPEGQ